MMDSSKASNAGIARSVPPASVGEVREWVGTCADVTERRLAEAAVYESEQRYRRL